jgi:hypothetical protein
LCGSAQAYYDPLLGFDPDCAVYGADWRRAGGGPHGATGSLRNAPDNPWAVPTRKGWGDRSSGAAWGGAPYMDLGERREREARAARYAIPPRGSAYGCPGAGYQAYVGAYPALGLGYPAYAGYLPALGLGYPAVGLGYPLGLAPTPLGYYPGLPGRLGGLGGPYYGLGVPGVLPVW